MIFPSSKHINLFFLQDKLAVDYKTYVLQSTEPELTRISQEMEMSSADLVF